MTVTFDKVRKTFDGKQVFSDFSYTLSLQGITALMGPSGCGKTTLLRLLWASALENVALVSDAETAKNILCKVGLAEDLQALPSTLSGGMQRRVALARALAHKSPLLLLDEPFKGLDADLCREMIALLRQEAQTRPIVFVTHSLQEAELARATVINLHAIQKNM